MPSLSLTCLSSLLTPLTPPHSPGSAGPNNMSQDTGGSARNQSSCSQCSKCSTGHAWVSLVQELKERAQEKNTSGNLKDTIDTSMRLEGARFSWNCRNMRYPRDAEDCVLGTEQGERKQDRRRRDGGQIPRCCCDQIPAVSSACLCGR